MESPVRAAPIPRQQIHKESKMLTFSRKSGQSVVIQVPGHAPLTITFLGSRPGRCQLAFDGPRDYHILREELVERDREVDRCRSMADRRCCAPSELASLKE
jgi:sRNA-binding carbon storage regulator CsrA